MQASIHFDSNGRDATIFHSHDGVEEILARNAELRKEEQRSDWGRHVASIPNSIYVQWLNEEYQKGNKTLRLFTPEFDALVERKLRDPDWFYLRTDRPALQAGWLCRG